MTLIEDTKNAQLSRARDKSNVFLAFMGMEKGTANLEGLCQSKMVVLGMSLVMCVQEKVAQILTCNVCE